MKKTIFLKKLCTVLILIIINSFVSFPVNASDVKISTLDSIPSINCKKNTANLRYTYNNQDYSLDLTDDDLNSLLRLFAPSNLIFDSPVLGEIADGNNKPQQGCFSLHDTDDFGWNFFFDESRVLIVHTRIIFNGKNVEKYLEQGYFTYKDNSIYSELNTKFSEMAKKLQAENEETYIYNVKTLYSAKFTADTSTVYWGIISYTDTEEYSTPIIGSYISLEDSGIINKITWNSQNNIITWDDPFYFIKDDITQKQMQYLIVPDNKNDKFPYIQMHINVNENNKIDNIYFYMDNSERQQECDVDMSGYIEEGSLPDCPEFNFSIEHNKEISVIKDTDTGKQDKTPETTPVPEKTPIQNDNIDNKSEQSEENTQTSISKNPNHHDEKEVTNQQSENTKDAPTTIKKPILPPANALTPDKVSVYINGELLTFDQNPIIESDRVLVPMRKIFEKLGAEIKWDSGSRTVTASKADITVIMEIGNSEMKINDKIIKLDAPPKIINSRTLVPLRAVSEALNSKVTWLETSKSVTIEN